MTTDETATKPTIKSAPPAVPTWASLNVRTETAEKVRKEAAERDMQLGAFADKLVSYALANLTPVDDLDLFGA